MNNQLLITIIILLIISFLFLLTYINSKKIPNRKKEIIFKDLESLTSLIKSPELYARRDAIIRLDNLLAKTLRMRYQNEETCGENLKIAKNLFTKSLYQNLWDVHKLRNEIVHKDKDIDYEKTQKSYRIYKLGITRILK
jgi:Leucine-rich repeat (LRR) protein